MRVDSSEKMVTQESIGNGTRIAPSGSTLVLVRGMSLLEEIRTVHATREVAFNQDVKALVAKPHIDPWFLTYAVQARHSELIGAVHLAGHGTGVLATERLKKLRLPVPSPEEQQRIVGVLGALDDLIETNEYLARTLDGLFHDIWAKLFASSGTLTERGVLADLCATQYGHTASATSAPTGVKFLRVTDINKRNWVDWETVPNCEIDEGALRKYRLRRGDLLVARMADPGKSAIVEHDVEAVFASYLVRLSPRRDDLSLFLFGYLKSRAFLDYAAGAMTGSVQKHMNAKVIAAAPVCQPDLEAIETFTQIASPIREQLAACIDEASQLRRTREELLPLLMSGKVRAGDRASIGATGGE
ncbi:type I restriction enzyme S subunit [Cryobacterium sp. MP_3.1]|nr:type I restriction enzyme S subunit [Cryobacterium sp. MP_3.1]